MCDLHSANTGINRNFNIHLYYCQLCIDAIIEYCTILGFLFLFQMIKCHVMLYECCSMIRFQVVEKCNAQMLKLKALRIYDDIGTFLDFFFPHSFSQISTLSKMHQSLNETFTYVYTLFLHCMNHEWYLEEG